MLPNQKNSPFVEMSDVEEERTVENPLAIFNDDQEDFDKEALIDALEQMD